MEKTTRLRFADDLASDPDGDSLFFKKHVCSVPKEFFDHLNSDFLCSPPSFQGSVLGTCGEFEV